MKKLSLLAAAILTIGTMTAQNVAELLPMPKPTAKTATASYSPEARPVSRALPRTTPPATIIGNDYVTTYLQGSDNSNGSITIVKGTGDTIIFAGIAAGNDLKGTYDATTGKFSIPTGIVIANDPDMGNITLHNLIEPTKYNDTPITGTFDADSIIFDSGIYTTVNISGTNYYVAKMWDIKAKSANAYMTLKLGTNNYRTPLIVTKTADNTISIVGMSSLLYAAYYEVPATFVESTNIATISSDTPVDKGTTSGSTNTYYLYAYPASGGLTADPKFDITVTNDASTLKAKENLFYCYDTNGQGSMRGYKFENFTITVNYNIYTAPVGGGTSDPTEATVDGIIYTLDNENNQAEVKGALASVTDLNIPSTITANDKTYTVVSVAATAFQNNKTITTVRIPASMKTVNTDAFRNMSNVRKVYIADLTSWCAIEFANGNANPIYNAFPTSTSNWGNVYIDGTETTTLTIPEGVQSIGRAFYGFKGLTAVTLPSSLTTLGDQAFANCISLPTVVLPENLDSLGSAFFGCSGLTAIEVPSKVKILKNTFYGCKSLTDVKLHTGLTTIGMTAFSGCSSLKKIDVPSSVTNIGVMAFYNCTAITEFICRNTVPPTCGLDVFEDFAANATLQVPEESISAYKEAAEWKTFKTITKITDAVNGVEFDSNLPAEYYNLAGVRVAADRLVPGIYVVRQGDKTFRILVK